MAYHHNISALAEQLEIKNYPEITEKDIKIAGLRFYNASLQKSDMNGTQMSKAERLYMQSKLQGDAAIHISDGFIADARNFFAETWTNKSSQKQVLLHALRTSVFVQAIWK